MSKNITIQDTGGAISLTIAGKGVLLNKPQIRIVEIIGTETLRIEMAGARESICIRASEVVSPVLPDVVALKNIVQAMLSTSTGEGNGDCACAGLIQQTNDYLSAIANSGITLQELTADNDIAKLQLLQQANEGITASNTALTEINGQLHASYEVLTNVQNNAINLNHALSDNHTANVQMLTQVNDGITNVINAMTEANNKGTAANNTLAFIRSNGQTLNQTVADGNAAQLQKLDNVLAEIANVTTNTEASGTTLNSIAQSASGTSTGVQATNELLADNQVATMQSLANLKTELVTVKTNIAAGNDQLSLLNQGNASIVSNGATGNQYLASLDGKLGQNGFLGNLSRKLKTITLQPTISTTAYAAGQVLGGVMTLTGALRTAILSGTWMGIQVVEKSTQKSPMDIVLFTQSPTGANFTDHAAAVWTLDYDKIIGINNIVAANYSTLATSCGVCLGNLNKRVLSTSSGNLYAVAICNGTPTYASASHLLFTFYFEQD